MEGKKENIEELMEEEAPNPESTESIMYKGNGETSMFSEETPLERPKEKESLSSMPISAPVKVDYSQSNIDEIEELIESVVDEKWRSIMENVGDIGLWKDKVRTEVLSIKQELLRLENRLENLQKAILGKVRSYDEHMVEVGSQIKALEKVFSRIVEPLTTNIKELDRLTKQLKK